MTSIQDKNRAAEWSFSFVQAGFWMSFCISVSFAAVYLQALGYSNSRLGVILALGSVMGIVVSMALSAWIDAEERITAKRLIPWALALQAGSVLVFLLFTCFVKDGEKAEPFGEYNSTLPAFLKNNRRYTILLTGVALLFLGHSIACNFLINLTRNVGGNTADLGFITAFKGLVEIPVMFIYVRFFKEGRHGLALRIAFRDSAKAQSLAFTTTTFGGMLASLIGGRMYDALSVTETLWAAFGIGLAGAVIVFLGTRRQ